MSDEGKDKTLSKKRRSRISKYREQIRKLYDAGYTQKEIQKETGAPQSTVSKELKKYKEEDPVNYYKVLESEEESKAFQKIEPIEETKKDTHTKKPLSVITQKKRVQARNRVYPPLKPKILKIKLRLNEFTRNKDAIRHALDNSNRWTEYNIKEIREYLKKKEETINKSTPKWEWLEEAKTPQGYIDPDSCINFLTKKELCEKLGAPYYYPEWMKYLKDLLDLKELSRKDSAIYKENLTTKEWYDRYEIEFPKLLEPEKNMVIENRHDLIRSGIFEELEYRIKTELNIENEFEHYYHTDELTPFDKTRIKLLIREKPKHPYSVPLKEKLGMMV